MTLAPREIIEAPAREWRRYPEYRDSGVEWLGDVPVHWEIQALKHTVKACRNGIWGEEPTGDSDDLVCVRVADFDRTRNRVGDSKLTVRSVPPSQQYGKVLNPGDLLIEKSGGGDLQPVGTVVLYDLDLRAVCSNFVARMPVVADCTPSFLCHLHAALYAGRINTRSIKQNTGIQNLDSKSYLQEKIGLPPLSEQRAIAAFLDRETRKIGDLIARRERLIELLEEKRTALISRAVTKGLDPDTPMKDSGVEWLGEIPEHWEIKRVKYLTERIVAGPFGSSLTKDLYTSEGYRVYGQEQVIPADFSIGDYYISEEKYQEMKRYAVSPGDVLVSCVGTFGKVAVVPEKVEPGIINPRLARLVPTAEIVDPEYLGFVLKSRIAFNQMEHISRGGTMGVINLGLVAEVLVPIPPVEEQVAMLDHLDRETKKIDALLGKLREHIEKLREYRTALISAAVTGKIDVREEVSAPADREPDKMTG